MVNKLRTWLGKHSIVFWQPETITRHNDELDYLFRITILKCALFAVFIHQFLAADDECLHDHPWWFVSIILWGGYYEYGPDGKKKWYGPGSILYRPATWKHRVVPAKGSRPITLVIAGPKSRRWGFHTKTGWIFWKDYDYHAHCSD